MKTTRTFQRRCACGIIAAGCACRAHGALQLMRAPKNPTLQVLAAAAPEMFHQNTRP